MTMQAASHGDHISREKFDLENMKVNAQRRAFTSVDKSQKLTEENVHLKHYIEQLDKECLELSAAVFEEANKMAGDAYAAQAKAEKVAAEKLKENEILRVEVVQLKSLLLREAQAKSQASDLLSQSWQSKSTCNLTMIPPSPNATSGKFTFDDSCVMPATKGAPKRRMRTMPAWALSTGNQNIIDLNTRKPATRKSLLDALLLNYKCSENVMTDVYKEFLDWCAAGCSLMLSSTPSSAPSSERVSSRSSGSKVTIYRELNGPATREHVTRKEKVGSLCYDSDVDSQLGDEAYGPAETIYVNRSSHLIDRQPSISSPTVHLKPGEKFLQRIYDEDIIPCLNFDNAAIGQDIIEALPYLDLEIEPLAEEKDDEECQLMLGHRCTFRLKLHARKDAETSDVFHLAICTAARHRIAAVADLFLYLSLIRRGVAASPALQHFSRKEGLSSDGLTDAHRSTQFSSIHRRRISVCLARLGYGLPDAE